MRWFTASLLALAVVAPASASRPLPTSALGGQGEVYRALTGSYETLFPGGALAPAGTRVLALDVIGPEKVDRWVVPGTEGAEVETSAAVVFESRSQTLYVVWTTNYNLVNSRISVVGFHDGIWGEPIEIVGDPFSLKSSPRIAVTRDTMVSHESGGGPVTLDRTILHALWWEEGGLGERILYSPLVLVDGEFVGDKPLLALHSLDGSLDEGYPAEPSAAVTRELALAPALDEGDGPNRLIASFALPRSGRLTVVELEPVPLELARLADSARAHVVEVGARACAGDTTMKIGDSARAHIVEVGRNDFHSSVIRHVAAGAAEALASIELGQACPSLEEHAASAEGLVIESAMDALRNGLLKKASSARAHIVEVGRSVPQGTVHKIRVLQTADRPAPPSGAGETHVFASPDGRRSLVAWRAPLGVAFVESRDESSWSEPVLLRTDDQLDVEEAIALLRRRIAER
ncbi:MAG TPA: hypothetical protein VNB06_12545 [Thermoanaerobaculia bacterium]|nr:hypothetical protein [Thermoanaerobaculia bacterium]